MRLLTCLGLLLLPVVACARSAGPLPGDSVKSDHTIALSPPRLSSALTETREALGPIESRLFPPELVMEHQNERGIGPAQKDDLLREVERGQAEVLRLQWELQGEK